MSRNWKRSVAFFVSAMSLLLGGPTANVSAGKPPSPPPPSPFKYSIQLLGTLGGAESGTEDMNEFGDVVGWSHTSDGSRHAFLYTASSGMQDLNVVAQSALPDGWELDLAHGINYWGQIVGTTKIVGNLSTSGFRYTPGEGGAPGEFLDLGALGMRIAYAINDSGDVVGLSIDADGRERACLYTDGDEFVQLLPLPSDGRLWRPQAINNNGQVTGYTTTVRTEAVRYTPNVVQLLGFLKLIASPTAMAATSTTPVRSRAIPTHAAGSLMHSATRMVSA